MTAALGLGTAQFGMDYGISNRSGRTPESEVSAILSRAWEKGVRVLDTAAAYGESEEVLGRAMPESAAFRVVTKTPPLLGLNGAPNIGQAFAEQLSRLRHKRIYGLLVHRADDLLGPWGDAIFAELRNLKKMGVVERIGASVYSETEIEALLGRFDLDLVQLPVNVFDQRLIGNGVLDRLKERGVEIHARSALLQGLLLMAPDAVPPFLRGLRKPIADFRAAARERGLSPLRAALSFVKNLAAVDVVIVGVTSLPELEEVLRAFEGDARFDAGALACADARLVNPALWRQ
jgi:aryl-alcohol dehydrogenase-like predicted oxidoreductase